MSIHWRNSGRHLLIRAFEFYGRPLSQMKMIEFGNQRLKFDPGTGARRLQTAKEYFAFLGIRHVALDLNGRNRAIPVDLGQPLDWAMIRDHEHGGIGANEADLVTNFGTSEHVTRDQFQVFANAHDACRFGGLMLHLVPAADSCRQHGYWKYTADWFEDLAHRAMYEILHLDEWDKTEHWGQERIPAGTEYYVRAIFRKRRNPALGRRFDASCWPGQPVRQR